MVDHHDPKTWTKDFVNANRNECLLYLRELNLQCISHIDSHSYFYATAGLDIILNGFDALLKGSRTAGLRICIMSYSCAVAELAALADPAAYENEMRSKGIRPKYTADGMRKYLREAAIAGFEDARDYAPNNRLWDPFASMLRKLKAGVSAEQIRREDVPRFPEDVIEALLELDRSFYVHELSRDAPDRCYVLDESRLLFTRKLVGNATPSSATDFAPVDLNKIPMSSKSESESEFDAWMDACGWDEEDLEWAYKRVKLRRNIYGVLSLFTPLGFFLFPFWLRAMYLTKMMKNRDVNAKPNPVAMFICTLYTIVTLFVYAAVMIWIIKRTNWGMGLGDRRARIPAFVCLGLLVFLIFQAGIISLPNAGGLAALPGRVLSGWTQPKPADGDSSAGSTEGVLYKMMLEEWRLRFTVPKEWEELCIVNECGSSVEFLQRDSSDWLFSLEIIHSSLLHDWLGDQYWQLVTEQDGRSLVAIFPYNGSFEDEVNEEYRRLFERIPEVLATVELENCRRDRDLSDRELLKLAEAMYDKMESMWHSLHTGYLVEQDESDVINDSYGIPCYRVLNCTSKDEVWDVMEEVWYQTFSRRYPLVLSDDEKRGIEDLFIEYNGALYVRSAGMGIGDIGVLTVDEIVSRTEDEVLFSAHYTDWYYEDSEHYETVEAPPFQFSLVYEDGLWKYGTEIWYLS